MRRPRGGLSPLSIFVFQGAYVYGDRITLARSSCPPSPHTSHDQRRKMVLPSMNEKRVLKRKARQVLAGPSCQLVRSTKAFKKRGAQRRENRGSEIMRKSFPLRDVLVGGMRRRHKRLCALSKRECDSSPTSLPCVGWTEELPNEQFPFATLCVSV